MLIFKANFEILVYIVLHLNETSSPKSTASIIFSELRVLS